MAMPIINDEAVDLLIAGAIFQSSHITAAQSFLRGEFMAGRFNTRRAEGVLSIAIDNAVWESLKNVPTQRLIYAEYKASRQRHETAARLVSEFKTNAGAEDQRHPRRFLRGLLGS